jgi:hypothetical protein
MPAATDVPSDLVATLEHAAVAVIQNQRPTLQHDPGSLRSVTIELEIDRRGMVSEAECYVGRRISTATILGVRG